MGRGRQHSTIVSILASVPVLGLIPSITKKFSGENIVGVADVNQRTGMEESGQWLENVD